MPRRTLCVFAFSWLILLSLPLHAATTYEDVPVPGGVDAFAGALGVDPTPDRGRFIFELTRLVHENPLGRRPPVAAFLLMLAQQPGRGARDFAAADLRGTDLVPVPLTA